MSNKIILVILAAVLATALGFPAVIEQETPLARMVRAASPDPHHHGHGGYGHGGYGHGGYGLGGYGHGGYGGGYPHGGLGGGYSQSSAHAGSISSPFGSASFASAKAGSSGYGR
ncbi:uncharacterized protein LOC143376162 isoform X2 [Andrena cerasifolii]|uniref:uncharacterized protein LOC143376162 isoform X2 n=1 Tax=Andrena cerasifolii TaxID=2819439 RepID=UPI004037B038